MIPRMLEPEVMDTVEEAVDYNAMDHSEVNRVFVEDFLRFAGKQAALTAGEYRSLLDVGTGTALIPIELCRQLPQAFHITAIDLAEEMLKLAEDNVQHAGLSSSIHLQRVDAKGLPFEDGQFDAVVSNSIIHHIPKPTESLREMIRVTKPGGLIFIRDLMRPDSSAEVEQLVQSYAGDENEHSRQMFRQSLHAALTVAEMQEMLAELGCPVEWVVATSDRHWTLSGCAGNP